MQRLMVLTILVFSIIRACQSFSSPHSAILLADSSLKASVDPSDLKIHHRVDLDLDEASTERGSEKLFLYSLQWTSDERISKPCRDVWKWKDAALGDGRDFFVPKPKTILALQDHLKKHCTGLSEISILSNCARLEFLVITKGEDTILDISRCLMTQVVSSKQPKGLSVLTQAMDVPAWALETTTAPLADSDDATELAHHWEILNDKMEILQHLCMVSSGMAGRPRRPERETIFRPFSSRDAHILLQLKRTKEVADGRQVNQLFEYALRAGKAARNVAIVPELELLKGYGTGDSKYSMDAPMELVERVAEAAIQQAILPLANEYCCATNLSNDVHSAIVRLRKGAEALAIDDIELSWVRKRLHQPTVDVREGRLKIEEIDVELSKIAEELGPTTTTTTTHLRSE